jgi:16S rRNA processing protein RimM
MPTGATLPGEASEPPADLVQVGFVLGAFGVNGHVKIVPSSPPLDSAIRAQKELWLGDADRPLRKVQVGSMRAAHDHFVVLLPEVPTREDALALGRPSVWVSRSRFPKIKPAEEYYWIDLIGCEAVNPGGLVLGKVTAMDDHGAHPIVVLATPEHGEQMIPFVAAYVLEVDVAGRRMVLDWLPEYFD